MIEPRYKWGRQPVAGHGSSGTVALPLSFTVVEFMELAVARAA